MLPCSKVNSIKCLIENLQRQLDVLVTELKPQSMAGSDPSALPLPSYAFGTESSEPLREPTSLPNFDTNQSRRSMSRFHGSSSSEYCLNLAQAKLCQVQDLDGSHNHETTPSLNNGVTADGELNIDSEDNDPCVFRQLEVVTSNDTTAQLPRLLSKSEALRLLHVYQGVVGDLHPIVGVEYLMEQVETLYTIHDIELSSRKSNALKIDDDDIYILNVVCSIALTAETTGRSVIGRALYHSVQGKIQTKMIYRETNTPSVVLLLLAVRSNIITIIYFTSIKYV